ncbi:MAG: DUF4288 domain-containing protein [Polyangiaceae bacterium]
MSWFSATVRLACLFETSGLSRYMDSVHVFQADGFEAAFQRALDIGRHHEESYINGEGVRVAWKLVSILTLDSLGAEIADGAEVCSGPVVATESERVSFDHVFAPEDSTPTQSI